MDAEPGQSGAASDPMQCPHCGVLHQADGSVSQAVYDRDGQVYAAVRPLRLLNAIDAHVAKSTNDGSHAVIEPGSGRVLARGATSQQAADGAESMARRLGRRRLQAALDQDKPIRAATTVPPTGPDDTQYPESWDVRSPEYRAAAGKAFADGQYALAHPDDTWAAARARTELRANPTDYLGPGTGQEMHAWDKAGEDDARLRAQNDLAMPSAGLFAGPLLAARAAGANERQVQDAEQTVVAEMGLAAGAVPAIAEEAIAWRAGRPTLRTNAALNSEKRGVNDAARGVGAFGKSSSASEPQAAAAQSENVTPPLMLSHTPVTNSISKIRGMPYPQRWRAAEEHVRELYGSPGQQHFAVPPVDGIVGSGGRFVDAPVLTASGGTLANEVKMYRKWTTVNGLPTQKAVPVTNKIQQQILKESWLRSNIPGYDPRWLFLDAPPSPELEHALSSQGINYVIYR